MLGLESHPRRREKIIAQQASGTLILLNLEDGHYYTLNEVGGRVWVLCDGSRRVLDVVATICQEYDATAETIAADILELLEELVNEQLVVNGSQQTAEGFQTSP